MNNMGSKRIAALAQLDIMHLTVTADPPGLYSIVVVDGSRAAYLYQLCAAGLNIAAAVRHSGLQHRLVALPDPVKVKTGQGLGQERALEPSFRQLRPPSTDTSTRSTVPRPLQAKPVMS